MFTDFRLFLSEYLRTSILIKKRIYLEKEEGDAGGKTVLP